MNFIDYPSTLQELNIVDDNEIIIQVCPTITIICIFLTSYSIYDVMAAGTIKAKYGYMDKDYKDISSNSSLSEEAYLADRAQMNQIECTLDCVVLCLAVEMGLSKLATSELQMLVTIKLLGSHNCTRTKFS